jgi:hypothetical protein
MTTVLQRSYIAYITTGLHLADLWEEWRQLGGHIVAVNGKSEFIQPLAIAQIMNIPTFIIFDADSDIVTKLQGVNQQTENARYQKLLAQKSCHENDNTRILKLLGQPQHAIFPTQVSWQDDFVVWPENIGSAIESDFLAQDWQRWKQAAQQLHGDIGGLEKNTLFIADLLAAAWAEQKTSPTLGKLCQKLIEFAKKSVT